MAQYLAKYNITAYEVSMGCGTPYDDTQEARFSCSTDKEAITVAQEEGHRIGENLFGATVRLERLLKTEEVPLEKKDKTCHRPLQCLIEAWGK